MERLNRMRQWSRWAGSLDDLVEATQLSLDTVAKASSSEPPCEIEVTWQNRSRTLTGPEGLNRRVSTRDLNGIKSVRIDVGEDQGTFVSIRAESKTPAMSLEVKGDDDTVVDGLFSQLDDVLSRGRRFGAREGLLILIAFSAAALVVGALFLLEEVYDFPRDRQGDADFPGWAFLVTLGPAAALVFALVWLVPELEILAPGQVTRFRRFRLWIVGFATAVIAGVVASLIVR
jgi:hypothetical protein